MMMMKAIYENIKLYMRIIKSLYCMITVWVHRQSFNSTF